MRSTVPVKPGPTGTTTKKTGVRDADDMAVASFMLGLPGLLVANIFLGPIAMVLATLALCRGTSRRGRAWFGMALGVTDLAVLAALVAADGMVSWSH
ncbi:hypothetical protein [Streptomyces sp. NBRC 110028]|uniref:hypothetical protein n=1 Tax=Streptomyces sp. NBRC 110028 TaxID=1621260 RepID=UPI0006E15CDB|nr:hypothetical protein [Streptomyces sp. NBRC 110028]